MWGAGYIHDAMDTACVFSRSAQTTSFSERQEVLFPSNGSLVLLPQGGGGGRDALEGKGPQRRPQRRLEEVAKAVGGGYCRLQMPSRPALGVRGTVAGHRLGALKGGGGYLPPSNASLGGGGVPKPVPLSDTGGILL